MLGAGSFSGPKNMYTFLRESYPGSEWSTALTRYRYDKIYLFYRTGESSTEGILKNVSSFHYSSFGFRSQAIVPLRIGKLGYREYKNLVYLYKMNVTS